MAGMTVAENGTGRGTTEWQGQGLEALYSNQILTGMEIKDGRNKRVVSSSGVCRGVDGREVQCWQS